MPKVGFTIKKLVKQTLRRVAMSIFVSGFSSGRFAGANLQGLPISQDGVKGRASASHRDRGIDYTKEEGEKAQRVVRDQEELLVSNQRATLLFENLRIFFRFFFIFPEKGDRFPVDSGLTLIQSETRCTTNILLRISHFKYLQYLVPRISHFEYLTSISCTSCTNQISHF